ncbi:uncharacterized protein [Spinacia oleracea]|uniref:Uncharacterized protein n=1 Tax=Spinacia oleracea TaxID=3562 RepID=A0ABM3QS15_SPIOL|nr:uncharacterized protein LOC130461898 [Spinacia oleracea]
MFLSKYTNIGSFEKLDIETPDIYVKKIVFGCEYYAKVQGQPILMRKDIIAATIINCLPNKFPYLELKEKFKDMHSDNGTPNLAKYGTWDGRWKYDSEILTTVIEAAESGFRDGKIVGSHVGDSVTEEPMGISVNNDLEENDVAVENENVGVEAENPNPAAHEPTIEISSDSDAEFESEQEMASEPNQDEDMGEDANPEEDPDEDPEEEFDDLEI